MGFGARREGRSENIMARHAHSIFPVGGSRRSNRSGVADNYVDPLHACPHDEAFRANDLRRSS